MSDIEERIKAAILRITSGQCSMRVPAEETDPDLVLADCLTEIRRLRFAIVPHEGYVNASAVLCAATRLRSLAASYPMARTGYIKAAEEIEMTVSAARPEVK